MSIHKLLLKEEQRINYPAYHFGDDFPFRIEPFIFNMAGNLSSDYTGGYWNMYELSNRGFYMAPDSDISFHVSCMNGYEGAMSADAFGITACLYIYSNLSFSGDATFAEVCAEHFHLLREYMLDHPEVQSILASID
jgi:hypothetical protein